MKHYETYLRAKAKDIFTEYYNYRFVDVNKKYAEQCMHDYMLVCDILKDLGSKFNPELNESRWINAIRKDIRENELR